MRAHQFEAEIRTSASKEIRHALRSRGYKLLGSGVDATVWAKSENNIIKVIMPDHGLGAGSAAETFYKFYEFCKQHENLENLPKFSKIGAEAHAAFTVDGNEYIMIAMERLSPIPERSFEQAMVWILSELATRRINWERAEEIINTEEAWQYFDDGMPVDQVIIQFQSLTIKELAKYQVLFALMTLLYHTGNINHQGWDLHTENAMMRGDTIVITDPWINTKT
jgi:hypothetical protein